MACEVDVLGRVVVYTTNKEQAEMKCEQITNYGPDWRLDHSTGSMRAKLEPADEKWSGTVVLEIWRFGDLGSGL